MLHLILLVEKNKGKTLTQMHSPWKILVEFKMLHGLLLITYVNHKFIFFLMFIFFYDIIIYVMCESNNYESELPLA